MMAPVTRGARWTILALALVAGACGATSRALVPAGTSEPDRFLFEKGTAALEAKKWLTAREFFKQLTETYTQSAYRPDAKLGTGDTYLGENTSEALVLAQNEFKEFLTFYPTHRRADYAQFKLGMSHFMQMKNPQRDQSETKDAIREFEALLERYPNSTLVGDAREKLRAAKDRLDASDYQVGYFYFRNRWYPGAIDRFKSVLSYDPGYSGRDALYYHLGESLLKVERPAEALPYFDKLVQEFEQSEYLEAAKKRVAELKAAPAAKGADAGTAAKKN